MRSYLLYATICYTTFQAFVCDRYDDDTRWLHADRSVDCESAEYVRHRAYAILALIFYVVGIPVFFFGALMYRKLRGAAAADEFSALNFLSGRFTDKAFWFDPPVMLFKAAIGGVFVFFKNSVLKFQFGGLVACLWIMLGAAIRPFPTFWQNLGHDMLNLGVFLFLSSGQLMFSEGGESSTRTANRIFLWIASAGMMAGTVGWWGVEVFLGKWRKLQGAQYLIQWWHALIGGDAAVQPAAEGDAEEEKEDDARRAEQPRQLQASVGSLKRTITGLKRKLKHHEKTLAERDRKIVELEATIERQSQSETGQLQRTPPTHHMDETPDEAPKLTLEA